MDPFVEVSLFVPGDLNAQKRRTAVVTWALLSDHHSGKVC